MPQHLEPGGSAANTARRRVALRREPPSPCPSAEALALYLDRRAAPAEADEIEAHLAICDDCLAVVGDTLEFQSHAPSTPAPNHGAGRRSLRWSGAIAAAVLLAFALPLQWPGRQQDVQPAVKRLQPSVGAPRRFEPRLMLDREYRPLASSARERDRAAAAAGALAARVRSARHNAPAGQVAMARAYLTLGDARTPVNALEPLAASKDAGILNDLAAAHLVRRGEGDTRRAFELLERAVRLDGASAPAWFNLALAAEANNDTARAIAAWQRTLALDPDSGWAKEARQHLQILTAR